MVLSSRTIDPRQLRVFVEIARLGGVSSAAEAMGMAKSAASRHLAQLERSLGLKLFERSARKVSLTYEGRNLLPKAESILADLDNLLIEAQEENSRVRGTVRIAGSPEFGEVLARKLIPILFRKHPDINVVLSLDYGLDDLHDPGVDVAFRIGRVRDDRLVARRLGEFSRMLVCSPDYQKGQDLKAPEDLGRAEMLIFSDRDLVGDMVLHHIANPKKQCVVKIRGRLAIRGFNALAGAAEAGLGVALLPPFVAQDRIERGNLRRVLPEFFSTPVPVHIVYRPNVARIQRVRAVIDTALEACEAEGGFWS